MGINMIKQQTDLVELKISQKSAYEMILAVNNMLIELQHIAQKLQNRINYSHQILMVDEQAYLLSKLLEYYNEKLGRNLQHIDTMYKDKNTAMILFNRYEQLQRRYTQISKSLRYQAKKCMRIEQIA